MTDEIIPVDLPQIREEKYYSPVKTFNDMLIVGMERPPYYFDTGGGLSDDLITLIVGIFTRPPMDTAKLNKYPGRVCIYRLLPEQGYVLEDIIVRDRDEKGELYFKSALY
jgi:hypothetical protein